MDNNGLYYTTRMLIQESSFCVNHFVLDTVNPASFNSDTCHNGRDGKDCSEGHSVPNHQHSYCSQVASLVWECVGGCGECVGDMGRECVGDMGRECVGDRKWVKK